MSDTKEQRQKFGHVGRPLEASRVLVKELDGKHFGGGRPVALIVINDDEGTFTSANVYGDARKSGRLGRNYDPENITHPLPPEGDERWKEWSKRGYAEGRVEDFDVLTPIGKPATAKAKS